MLRYDHLVPRFLARLFLTGLAWLSMAASCQEIPPEPDPDDPVVPVEEDYEFKLCDSLRVTVEQVMSRTFGDLLDKAADGAYYYNVQPDPVHVEFTPVVIPDTLFSSVIHGDLDLPLFAFEGDGKIRIREPLQKHWTDHKLAVDYVNLQLPREMTLLQDLYLSNTYLRVTVSLPEEKIQSGSLSAAFIVGQDGWGIPQDGFLEPFFRELVLNRDNGYTQEQLFGVNNLINLSPYDAEACTIEDEVTLSPFIEITSANLVIKEDVGLHVTFELLDPCIRSVVGYFEFPEQTFRCAFPTKPVPELLAGHEAFLDFQNPKITVDLASNLGRYYRAESYLSGWKDGAGVSDSLRFSFRVPLAKQPSSIATNSFVIGQGLSSLQSEDFNLALTKVLGPVPDSVVCDMHFVQTEAQGYIYPDAVYWMDITPSVHIPIAFGEDFTMTFRETTGAMLFLKDKAPILSGTVENRTPVMGDFSVVLIDKAGETVATTAVSELVRNAKKTVDLPFTLQEGKSFKDAIRAVIVWRAHWYNHYGLRASDYVEYRLTLHS